MLNRKLLCSTIVACAALSNPASAAVLGVFHENLNDGDNSVFVFGAEGTTGTITGGGGLNENFLIDNTGVFTFNFGSRGREMVSNGAVNTLSYRVDSADPISALALNRAGFSTDMTTLLDTDGLGKDYYVLTTPGVFGSGSQMSVTATENNTVVTIQSQVALAGNAADTPFQVTLQAGESVFYESGTGGDLSGTRVTSDKDVAVFGGAECTQVPVGTTFCDHLVAQQFSVDNYDTEFNISTSVLSKSANGDVLRVIASQDDTEVFLNGVSQGTINAGEVLDLADVDEGLLTSSKAVMAGQFIASQQGSPGDPAFAVIPSVDQQLKSYAYATPVGFETFDENWLNIAIDAAIASTLSLNGAFVDTSLFENIDGTLFGNLAIDAGFGVIEAADTFLATISGFEEADSYFSPIATAFSPGVSPPPDPIPDPDPTPPVVPLPAAGWLLIAGIGGLAAMKRRKES